MKLTLEGYTIVEVLIVFAITGAILLTAMTTFSSQNGSTQFTQATQDFQSKLRTYVSQVNAGAFSESEQWDCNVSGYQPYLVPEGAGSAVSECIYLGQAVQLLGSGDSVISYPVLGTRYAYDQITHAKKNTAATGFDEANPTPAVDSSGTFVAESAYKLTNGLTVKSVKAYDSKDTEVDPGHQSGLIGFYSRLEGSTTATPSGNAPLLTKAYRVEGPVQKSVIKDCIQKAASCNQPNPDNFAKLVICLTNGDKDAGLSVYSTATGVTTSLRVGDCAP